MRVVNKAVYLLHQGKTAPHAQDRSMCISVQTQAITPAASSSILNSGYQGSSYSVVSLMCVKVYVCIKLLWLPDCSLKQNLC